MSFTRSNPQPSPPPAGDEGFLLIGAIVMIALVLIVLAIAAPRVAHELRREKEVEAIHRGNQYVRAIQLYYRKFGHYPGSLDQLVQTNNIRFLRQKYSDPITGQDDFAIIPVGQNKTTVKTFFGEPLTGLPGTGPGSVANMLSPGIGIGASAGAASATAAGASSATSTTSGAAAAATGTTSTTGAGSTGSSSGPLGSSSSASSSGLSSGGLSQAFMGVSLGAKGDSITELNEQTDYGSWEFLYDPRLDQLKARAAALNGAPGSVAGSSLGQPSIPSGLTSTPTTSSGSSTTPASGTTTPTTQP